MNSRNKERINEAVTSEKLCNPHMGKKVTEKDGYQVIDCTICGYKHLYPIPLKQEIDLFYKNKYFKLIDSGGRAPEIRKQISNNKDEISEIEWLKCTYYQDILDVLDKNIREPVKKILDIGSGTGQFLEYMSEAGWDAVGIEPSEDPRLCSPNNCAVFTITLEKFCKEEQKYLHSFDAVTLLNVLEHVPDPVETLRYSKKLLKPHTGIICIRVPNDFNELQACAAKKINKGPWWVAIPDHINYFDVESLKKIVESVGFEIIDISTDFPMELFLLMGEDYVVNPKIGSICHRKRVNFDLSIPADLRKKIYRSLASMGLGRDSMIFARSGEDNEEL